MIPIVFGIDKSYMLQVFTLMHSILKNTVAEIHFIVLSNDRIEEDAEELVNTLRKVYDNFAFDVRHMTEETFHGVEIHHGRLTLASYFRLMIPELVKEYDKCIYLDSDILVNGDIQELFAIDVEACYLAGVRDCHLGRRTNVFVSRHQSKMNMASMEKYVNAGVLLMNLKKMRDDDITYRFLAQAKRENPYEDQDVINVCCEGAKKVLPLKYNVFHHYKGRNMKTLFNGPYDRTEFRFDWNDPCILHFAEEYKPWLNRKYKGADQWWKLAELYKDFRCYQNVFRNCREAGDELRDMKQILEACAEREKIILWGFTDQGREVCDIFFRRGISPYAFCDNDGKKTGKSYRGLPVVDFDSVMRSGEKITWVVTCKHAYREVQKQLKDAGIAVEDIFHFAYNNRTKKDYLVLDPGYYGEEVQVIALCENDISKMEDEAFLSYLQKLIEKADIQDEMYRYLYSKYRFDMWLKT